MVLLPVQFFNLTLHLAKVDNMTLHDNLCQSSKHASELSHGTKNVEHCRNRNSICEYVGTSLAFEQRQHVQVIDNIRYIDKTSS